MFLQQDGEDDEEYSDTTQYDIHSHSSLTNTIPATNTLKKNGMYN